MASYFKVLIALFVGVVSPTVAAADINSDQVAAILVKLDNELQLRDQYIAKRLNLIDSLRGRADKRTLSQQERLDSRLKLAESFVGFNADSAIYHYTIGLDNAVKAGNDSLAVLFTMRRAAQLPLDGYVQAAMDDYLSVDTAGISPTMKKAYFDSGRQMYSYMASFCVNRPAENERFSHLALECQANLLLMLDPQSAVWKLNQGEYYFLRGEYSKANAILENLMDNLSEDDNMFARAAHFLSDIAAAKNEPNGKIYYLALSAIADTRAATREVSSLQDLGRILFGFRDVERAHNYLSVALQNAVECNAPLRILESAESLPIIEKAHQLELDGSRRRIYVVIALMALLLLGLIATMTLLRRKMRSMDSLSHRLEDAGRVKDVYINQFLNLCSIYMDRLSQFSKTVNRKIASGQTDELFALTKSGKFIEEQSREFYDVFDDAFLHIYPDFVDDVNRLLRDGEKIELKEGEKLNTDLRILAFMRLGIDESSRIAQLLNYSVYTIYTYRNKLKNRAVSRDTLETDIMNIKSI